MAHSIGAPSNSISNFQEGLDQKSGSACKFWLKRFVEMSGTYRMVSRSGFEKFAHAMGASSPAFV